MKMIKKCEMCGIKQKDHESFLGYTNFKDNFIEEIYLCNKNYKKKV